MIKYQVYNQQADKIREDSLSEKVFGLKPNMPLWQQVVVGLMANSRTVIAHTKGRAEVRGGGRKPWKQKGTGRARVGSSRSPLWKGGGVTFGPTNERNFSVKINDKMKRKAMCIVLSDKVNDKNLILLDDLKISEYKTKAFDQMVANFSKKVLTLDEKAKRSFLIVNYQQDNHLSYSARNLSGVKVINFENLNIIDILQYKYLILTADAVNILNERYSAKN
jgi:large subunit ribosomal protein L4